MGRAYSAVHRAALEADAGQARRPCGDDNGERAVSPLRDVKQLPELSRQEDGLVTSVDDLAGDVDDDRALVDGRGGEYGCGRQHQAGERERSGDGQAHGRETSEWGGA
jgi:hypothetical protein